MHIHTLKKEEIVVLQLIGKIDSVTSTLLGRKVETLLSQKQHHIIFDFSEVEFISSSGLRVLLQTAKKSYLLKGKIALCAIENNLQDQFEIVGFNMIFPIFQNQEEALQKIAA